MSDRDGKEKPKDVRRVPASARIIWAMILGAVLVALTVAIYALINRPPAPGALP